VPIVNKAGDYPFWLAPEQVRLLTICYDATHVDYTQSTADALRGEPEGKPSQWKISWPSG